MDIAKQVFEEQAEGWQRGLYEDIRLFKWGRTKLTI